MTWYDFRLKLHNMKTNINMNTLTNTEKEAIWVPSLVFSNTEQKANTVNDPKAFALARFMNQSWRMANPIVTTLSLYNVLIRIQKTCHLHLQERF